MKPTVAKASGGKGRGGGRRSLVPLATVLTRLDEAFEEPLVRAALLPGYPEYEMALAEIDGWPAAGDTLVFLKVGKDEPWPVVAGLHVLAAAKKVGKADVPCSFITKEEVSDFMRANAEGGLKPPRASAEDEEEAAYRAYWPD